MLKRGMNPVANVTVKIYTVDKETFLVKSNKYVVMQYSSLEDTLKSLKKITMVGEMVRFEDGDFKGMIFVRVRGGFRKATDEDVAVMLAGEIHQ